MSEFKGTPGPWTAASSTIFGHGMSGVCSMLGCTDMPVPKANARLIAAAPDLLEALQAFVSQASAMDLGGWGWEDEIEAGERAIARALGEHE